MEKPTFFDPTVWDRGGYGRVFEFVASDETVAAALADKRLDEFRPLSLYTSNATKNGRYYDWKTERSPEQAFLERCKAGDWMMDISSPVAHPEVSLDTTLTLQRTLSINGFLCLQHYSSQNSKRSKSSLSVVDKITSMKTFEKVEHSEAFRFYKTLKSALQRAIKQEQASGGTPTKLTQPSVTE